MKVVQAISKIYPEIKGGFVYWETKFDGTPWKNWIEGLQWENTEFAKPTKEQIEGKFAEVELESKKETLLKKRNLFLSESALPYLEDTESMPIELKEKRSCARHEVLIIKSATNIEEIKDLKEDFHNE